MLPFDAPAYIILPPPISTNNLFANVPGRGRIVTKDYLAWKRHAAQTIFAQRPLLRIVGPVAVTFFVGEVGIGQMDSDNTAKAYLDALVKAQVIRDDKRSVVRQSRAVWVPGLRGCVAEIRQAQTPPSVSQILARVPAGLHELLR
jgi:Holliday junction resolvase RusA-like endonuclease